MGMLDGLIGNLMGGMMGGQQGAQGTQGGGQLMQAVLQIVQQQGGITGLLAKLQQAGYGQQVQSWIGTGQNQPISADALTKILGQGQLGQIAQQLGMSHQDAAGGLAQVLPQVVDHMTPNGQIPDDHSDIVSQALELLRNKNA